MPAHIGPRQSLSRQTKMVENLVILSPLGGLLRVTFCSMKILQVACDKTTYFKIYYHMCCCCVPQSCDCSS